MEAATLLADGAVRGEVVHDPVEVVLLLHPELVAQLADADAGALAHGRERLVAPAAAGAATAATAAVPARRTRAARSEDALRWHAVCLEVG